MRDDTGLPCDWPYAIPWASVNGETYDAIKLKRTPFAEPVLDRFSVEQRFKSSGRSITKKKM